MSQRRDAVPGSRGKPRRTYKPPKVSKVPIRVDEVVLAACKDGGSGNEFASCVMGCAIPGS